MWNPPNKRRIKNSRVVLKMSHFTYQVVLCFCHVRIVRTKLGCVNFQSPLIILLHLYSNGNETNRNFATYSCQYTAQLEFSNTVYLLTAQ